jgi:hypothetical protein
MGFSLNKISTTATTSNACTGTVHYRVLQYYRVLEYSHSYKVLRVLQLQYLVRWTTDTNEQNDCILCKSTCRILQIITRVVYRTIVPVYIEIFKIEDLRREQRGKQGRNFNFQCSLKSCLQL